MDSDELQSPLDSLFSSSAPASQEPTSETELTGVSPERSELRTVLTADDLFSDTELAPFPAERSGDADVVGRAEILALEQDEPTAGERVLPGTGPDSELAPGSGDPLLGQPARESATESKNELVVERERILNVLLGGATVAGGVAVASLVVVSIESPGRLPGYILFIAGYALVVAMFFLRRIPFRWRRTVLLGVAYAVALASLVRGGATGTGPWYLLAIPVLFSVLVGTRAGVLSGMASVALYGVFALAHHLQWLPPSALPSLEESFGQYLVFATSYALIAAVVVVVQLLSGRAQRRARESMRAQSEDLREAHATSARRERELEEANTVLQRQAQYFELRVQIGRVAAMVLPAAEFGVRVAQLIHEHVESHYVGIFELDEDRSYAQMLATAGVPQEAFTPRQQRVPVSADILLQQCVSSGRARLLLGIDQVQNLSESRESLFLLPDTRSAIALPMIAGGQVLGTITVQSQSPSAYRNEDLVSLRTVADQVSTAISNARLADELGERLAELETLQRYYVREAWERFLSERVARLYEYDQPGVESLGDQALPEVERVLAEPRLTVLTSEEASAPSALVLPISLREQVLGVLGLHRVDSEDPWTDDQIELLSAISEQMGLIIENSRLFAEAQSRAARERRAREITARMRESLDVEAVLRTAALEMGQALELCDVTIQLAEGYELPSEG